MAIALASMYRTLIAQRVVQPVGAAAPAPVVKYAPVSAVAPVLRYAPASAPPAPPAAGAVPEVHSCGGRCGSLPSSSTPATAGGPGAVPGALPAPSLSLATVGSTQLPPPAGSMLANDSAAPPKASDLGPWLQQHGGLWLWVLIAIVLILVMAPGSGRRTSW